ncbi:MAG: hypothetical protein ACE1ZP_00055, partial [Myxococcota bacterium]
ELAQTFEIPADTLSGECRGIAAVQIEDQFNAVFIHMILLGSPPRGARIMGPMWCGVHNRKAASPERQSDAIPPPINPG